MMFNKIRYQDYRGFKDLSLSELGRVNLVVGRNNTGKTAFLEGLVALAQPRIISSELHRMFRIDHGNKNARFFRWIPRDSSSTPVAMLGAGIEDGSSVETWFTTGRKDMASAAEPQRAVIKSSKGDVELSIAVARKTFICPAVAVHGRAPDTVVKNYAAAAKKKGGEEMIHSILNKVDPRIQKIRVDPGEDGNILVVDVGLSEMIPLSQAGQGVYRMVTILADLIGQTPDLCCIDEIENGIHHTALETLWTGVAEAAATLGVQVFATTHSHECLEAAHAVFSQRASYDLRVIQLYQKDGAIDGRVLDPEMIRAGIEGQIDLR